jgi:hypothetical protein
MQGSNQALINMANDLLYDVTIGIETMRVIYMAYHGPQKANEMITFEY